MERAVQFLYPVELSCDSVVEQTKLVELNPEAPEFRAKPKRDAAAAAELRIKELVQEDNVDIQTLTTNYLILFNVEIV
jgi:hypothetical protein